MLLASVKRLALQATCSLFVLPLVSHHFSLYPHFLSPLIFVAPLCGLFCTYSYFVLRVVRVTPHEQPLSHEQPLPHDRDLQSQFNTCELCTSNPYYWCGDTQQCVRLPTQCNSPGCTVTGPSDCAIKGKTPCSDTTCSQCVRYIDQWWCGNSGLCVSQTSLCSSTSCAASSLAECATKGSSLCSSSSPTPTPTPTCTVTPFQTPLPQSVTSTRTPTPTPQVLPTTCASCVIYYWWRGDTQECVTSSSQCSSPQCCAAYSSDCSSSKAATSCNAPPSPTSTRTPTPTPLVLPTTCTSCVASYNYWRGDEQRCVTSSLQCSSIAQCCATYSSDCSTSKATTTCNTLPTECNACTQDGFSWCGDTSKCVTSGSLCSSSQCTADPFYPSDCLTYGATSCASLSGPYTQSFGLKVPAASVSFGAGLGVTLALSLLASLALLYFICRFTPPPKIASHGSLTAVQQQKAIRAWALSSSASVLFFVSGLLGLAAPAVPWLAIQFTFQGGGYQYIVISLVSFKAQTCFSGNCQDLNLGLSSRGLSPKLTPSAALQYLGSIFLLVGSIISSFIAYQLKRLAHTGSTPSSVPCCHSPAAQGFVWAGFSLYFIGAIWGGAVFIDANNSLYGNALGAAPGGVMAAFVVLASLAGCIITAVVNCKILGVTGVGQSSTHCCCGQEGEGLAGTPAQEGVKSVSVIMSSPLGVVVNPLGSGSSVLPPPPP